MSQYSIRGGGVSAPSVLGKVEPEYSEEARKAKCRAPWRWRWWLMIGDTRGTWPLAGSGLDQKGHQVVENGA